MPRRRESTAELIAHQDFAALERQARTAVREGDTAALEVLRRDLLDEVLRRWHERPLPRLAELATVLGRHCGGRATARLAEDTRKKLPDELWETLLAEADGAYDTLALLEAAARGTSDAIHFRVETLRERFAAQRDPQVTSALLRWLEAPPIRAVSSQPMWNDVFEILFAQGDPRTLAGYAALLEAQFPAGKTMQGWIASRLRTELARFEARDDADALAALASPGAEGDQAVELDGLAVVVAALTGEELVARGGEVLTASLEGLLRAPATPVASPWAEARSARPHGLAVTEHGWHDLRVCAGGRVALNDEDQLVVLDADDRLLWQLRPARVAEEIVSGYALSPSGRWLALVRGGLRVVVMDLDDGVARHLDLPLPPATASDHQLTKPVRGGRCVLWTDDDTLLSAHVVSWDAPMRLRQATLVLVETRFDAEHAHIVDQRLVDLHPPPPEALNRACTPATGQPEHAIHQADATNLASSPDGRWLVVGALDTGYSARWTLLERSDDGWHPRQRFEARMHAAWSEQGLCCRPIVYWNQPEATPGFLDPTTAFTTLDEAASAGLRSTVAEIEALERGLPVPGVHRLAVAARADVVAVGVSPSVGTFEVQDSNSGEVLFADSTDGVVHALAVAPDGESFAYAAKSSYLVQAIRGGKPRRVKGHKDRIEALAFSESEPVRIVSLAADGVMVWSDAGERLVDLRHRSAPRGFALRSCGQVLATREADRITLWDLAGSGHELATVELDHEPATLAWSADETALLWLHGADLWRWQPATDAAPQIACTHDATLLALASRASTATCAVSDAGGRVLLVEPDGDGLALRPVLDGLEAPGTLAVDGRGRIVVGSGRRGLASSMLVLEADGAELEEMRAPAASEPLPGAADLTARLGLDRFEVAPSEVDVARARVLARAPRSAVAGATVAKLRKGMRHKTRRAKAIEQFAAAADEALWEATLAEIDPNDQGADPVLGLRGYQSEGWMIAWLAHAPPGIELVEAWQRRLTHTGWPDPLLPLEALRSPFVEKVSVDRQTTGSDLRGLPALREVHLERLQSVEDAELVEALLTRLVVDDDKRLDLQLSASKLTRLPRLAGTPFEGLSVAGSAIRNLAGLEPLRRLSLLHQNVLEDLDGIEACTRLERLNVTVCKNLGSLRGLEGALAAGAPLRQVHLAHLEALVDISALAGAKQLETLTLNRVGASSLRGLQGCKALRELVVDALPVASLEGIDSARLEQVTVTAATELTDATALAASAHTLHTLSLSGSAKLTSLDWLGDATSLRTLDLRGCASLATLSPLENCTQLHHIWLHGTPVTPDDVSPWLRERASWAATPLPL